MILFVLPIIIIVFVYIILSGMYGDYKRDIHKIIERCDKLEHDINILKTPFPSTCFLSDKEILNRHNSEMQTNREKRKKEEEEEKLIIKEEEEAARNISTMFDD